MDREDFSYRQGETVTLRAHPAQDQLGAVARILLIDGPTLMLRCDDGGAFVDSMSVGMVLEGEAYRPEAAYSFTGRLEALSGTSPQLLTFAVETGSLARVQRRAFCRLRVEGRALVRLVMLKGKSPEIQPMRRPGLRAKGLVENLSAGGALVRTKAPLHRGDLVHVSLDIEGLRTLRELAARVRRVRVLSDKSAALAGVEFLDRERYPAPSEFPEGRPSVARPAFINPALEGEILQFIYRQMINRWKTMEAVCT